MLSNSARQTTAPTADEIGHALRLREQRRDQLTIQCLDKRLQQTGYQCPPTLAITDFQIGPSEWTVRLVDGEIEHEGKPARGLCDSEAYDIIINAQLPLSLRRHVLWHEVAHAFDVVYNESHFNGGYDEETLAHVTANGLAGMKPETFTRLNKWIELEVDDAADAPPCVEIPVGPMAYRAFFVDGFIDFDGDDCLGLCDHVENIITLSNRMPIEQRRSCFWHEVGHAWNRVLNVVGPKVSDEQFGDIIGLAMPSFTPDKLAEIEAFLQSNAAFDPSAHTVPQEGRVAAVVGDIMLRFTGQ